MSEAEDIEARMAILQNLALSRGVEDDQLFKFAQSASIIELNENASPLHTEVRDTRFFIVVSGQVRARFMRGKRTPFTGIIRPGEFFGAEKLLYGQTSLESAVALVPTTLICIDSVPLAEILRTTPRLRTNLKERSRLYRLRHNKHYAWLNENENVEINTRKHPLVLLIALIAPLAVGWLGVFFFLISRQTTDTFLEMVSSWISIGLFGVAFLWGLWRLISWSIDVYIVTDQRIVWQEQVIGLYDSRVEIPMAMAMPPRLTQSRLERILGFGDVFILTDRTPVDYQVYVHIDFRDIIAPEQVQQLIETYRKRASQKNSAEEEASIENVITQLIKQQESDPQASTPPPPAQDTSQVKPPLSKRVSDTFKTRLEENGVITYRKHWVILFNKVWLPTLVSMLVLGLLAYLLELRATNQIASPSILTIICAGFFVYTIPVIWWIYQVLDWRNDIYQISGDRLLDIEKKPFFGQIISKPYLLSKIRSLDFDRISFLEKLRNSGSIYIGTVDDKLVFHGVSQPDRILREIYYRIIDLRRNFKAAELRSSQETAYKVYRVMERQTPRGRQL